jgi:hypothetical protein
MVQEKRKRRRPDKKGDTDPGRRNTNDTCPGNASRAGNPCQPPKGKNHQNHRIPLSGYPSFLPVNTGVANPGCFPGKTGCFFPGTGPPLFFGHHAAPDLPEIQKRPVDPFFFRDEKNAAKLHGFFPIKTACFQKYRFKERIVERIGTASTGTSRTWIRPGNLPSEKGSMERVDPVTPILMGRGMPVRRKYASRFSSGSVS